MNERFCITKSEVVMIFPLAWWFYGVEKFSVLVSGVIKVKLNANAFIFVMTV